MGYKGILTHRKDKKKDETPLCAMDFETRGLGGEFIVGAFVTDDGQRDLVYSLDDAFNYILQHPQYRYLAHNASGYEFAYLYSCIYQYFLNTPGVNIQPTLQGENRIVQFKITKHHITKSGRKGKLELKLDIRDTLCLFNTSLENVAKAWCPEIPKLEMDWNDEHDNFDPGNPAHVRYVFRDCEVVLVAYRRFVDLLWNLFGRNPGVTAGSVAMRAFESTIPEGVRYARNPEKKELFFRKAYYGGAVFPGHQIGDWGATTSIDINGAYGFHMGSKEFPTSTPAWTHRYIPNRTGIYHVLATVPKELFTTLGFNPLPYRTKNGLTWPSGTFDTHITHIEYEYAVKHGCTIQVLSGYVWEQDSPVFKTFIDTCQELEIANGGEYKPLIKLLRNSLYGKFGTKSTHTSILFSMDGFPETPCVPMLDSITGRDIEGVYVAQEQVDAYYILPEWAALITAYERIYLFEFIEMAYAYGASNVYCDTDSLKCNSSVINALLADDLLPIGNRYGEFKIEEHTEHFIVLASKTYCSDTEQKAKGLPKRVLDHTIYGDALAGIRKERTFVSVINMIALMKNPNATLAIKRKRKITDIMNSEAWVVDKETGVIHARHFEADG